MTYHYKPGTVRWRVAPKSDVRAYRPPNGWSAVAHVLDDHPVTGRPLRKPGWWICETYDPS